MRTEDAVKELIRRGLTVTTAESCTGGMLAGRIVDTPGSSAVFYEAFVTYSNEAKHRRLGVSEKTLQEEGAVSAACAAEMAQGARAQAGSDIALATTGIAGPDGGSEEKPVGLVYIGLATEGETRTERHVFRGDRQQIRGQTVEAAMQMLAQEIETL